MRSLMALAIGFAVAGLLSTGYQLLTVQPPSFRLLNRGPQAVTLAAVPFLVFAAPFIIIRNTIRGAGSRAAASASRRWRRFSRASGA